MDISNNISMERGSIFKKPKRIMQSKEHNKVTASRKQSCTSFLEDIRMSQLMDSESDIPELNMKIEVSDLDVRTVNDKLGRNKGSSRDEYG